MAPEPSVALHVLKPEHCLFLLIHPGGAAQPANKGFTSITTIAVLTSEAPRTRRLSPSCVSYPSTRLPCQGRLHRVLQ